MTELRDMVGQRSRRKVAVDFLVIGIAATACLMPFVNRAYNIDDPLFLWTARHITSHPADFFGFSVNWYGADQPMSRVTQNPPLACYYAAGVGAVFGWSEPVMHLAFFLPALAALWGTYRLAELFGGQPLLAALMALTTPVFLVSSTTVMCDVLMTALWIWTVVLWERGSRASRPLWLLAAGGLIVLCALTKYYGLCLIPLLGAYSLAARRPWRQWAGPLLLAALALAGYQLLTRQMYGKGLMTGAMGYATSHRPGAGGNIGDGLLTLLAFTGGSLGAFLFFGPWLWARASALAAAAGDAALASANKRAADHAAAAARGTPGTVWFQGHWGFQYYMQEAGARPWDVYHPERVRVGDRVLVPLNNISLYRLPPNKVSPPRLEVFGPVPWATTMNNGVGAGFYSDYCGRLPFYLGSAPPEGYKIYDVVLPFESESR